MHFTFWRRFPSLVNVFLFFLLYRYWSRRRITVSKKTWNHCIIFSEKKKFLFLFFADVAVTTVLRICVVSTHEKRMRECLYSCCVRFIFIFLLFASPFFDLLLQFIFLLLLAFSFVFFRFVCFLLARYIVPSFRHLFFFFRFFIRFFPFIFVLVCQNFLRHLQKVKKIKQTGKHERKNIKEMTWH